MTAFITRNKSRILRGVTAAVFWLAVWFIASIIINKEILFVSPYTVLLELIRLIQIPRFWLSVGNTLIRIMAGFILAVAIGTALAFLTSYSKIAYSLIKPAISVISATPVASFIILALLWIKSSTLPMFISMLMVMPIIWQNVQEGISRVDKKQMEMARVFGLGRLKIFKSIILPSVVPFLLAGCISGLGFAWKSGVAAEVICQPRNTIGTNLYESKLYLETPSLFAWTAVIVILSIIIERLMVFIIKNVLKNYLPKEERHAGKA